MTEQEATKVALHIVREQAADALYQLSKMFKPEATMTFVAWVPGHDDRTCLVTDCKDIDGLCAAIKKVGDPKATQDTGGYRAGFEDGQAAASKTIAGLQAQVAALKATVDQCRAANFIDAAGNEGANA